jgi:hypothetical protein
MEVLYFKMNINVTSNFMKCANLSYQIIIHTGPTYFMIQKILLQRNVTNLLPISIKKWTPRSRTILGGGGKPVVAYPF